MFPYRLASECTQKLEILRPHTSYKVLLCNIFGTLIHPPAPSQAKESFPGVAASYIITLMRPCPKHIEKESSEVSWETDISGYVTLQSFIQRSHHYSRTTFPSLAEPLHQAYVMWSCLMEGSWEALKHSSTLCDCWIKLWILSGGPWFAGDIFRSLSLVLVGGHCSTHLHKKPFCRNKCAGNSMLELVIFEDTQPQRFQIVFIQPLGPNRYEWDYLHIDAWNNCAPHAGKSGPSHRHMYSIYMYTSVKSCSYTVCM